METGFLDSMSFERTWAKVEHIAMIGFDTSMTIRFWNQGAGLLYGYGERETVGHPATMLGTDDHYEPDYMEKLMAEGILVEQCWQRHQNGTVFWAKIICTVGYSAEGKVVGFTQIIQNVSVVGVGLTISQNDGYEESVDDLMDYGVLLLSKEGIILNMSGTAQRMMGYSSAEMVGKHMRLFYAPEAQASGVPERLLSDAAISGRVYYEGWRMRKDGQAFWGVVALTALTNWRGQVAGYYKVVRDLTERKKVQESREKYVDHLEKHSKEIEELAYIASHDLKEPIRTIIGLLDLFYEHYAPVSDETGLDYIDKIRRSTDRMQELVHAVLNYSLIGAKREIAFIDINGLLDDVEKDLHESIVVTGTVIERQLLPSLKVYPIELRQLFQNLISNAIKFRRKDVNPHISISAVRLGLYWKFAVADNGIGFDEKFGERIFKLFQRLHPSKMYEGTGIGLSYAKKIIMLHGGDIWARSTRGEGSQFYFTIPTNLENEQDD